MKRFASGAVAGLALSAVLLSASAAYAGDAGTHDHKDGAKICYVDHFKYTDKGGYDVETLDLVVVQENKERHYYSGSYYPKKLGKEISNGESLTVNLNDFVGVADDFGHTSMRGGREVWLKIPIVLGEEPTCHKDGHKLVFKPNIGRMIEFKSEGTTKNNNRCEYKTDISKQCDGTLPSP
jgi:hypothetical protein